MPAMLFRLCLRLEAPSCCSSINPLEEPFALFPLSTKFCKITVDTYRRLVLDPKSEPENGERKDASEVLSLGMGTNQPDSPTDKSMEISSERKIDMVSDPNYPSYEILLDVAGKLLESFEKL
jgi:hypothetical protein